MPRRPIGAKDRFLATLSHELRTPLTPILATVTAMLDDPATPAATRTVLEMIRRNMSLEARLIDDLLDRARIRSGKPRLDRRVVDAHRLVHNVLEICGEDLRKDCDSSSRWTSRPGGTASTPTPAECSKSSGT